MPSYERLTSAMRRYHTAAWICFMRMALIPVLVLLTFKMAHSESAPLHIATAFLIFVTILMHMFIFVTLRDLMRFAFRSAALDTIIYMVIFAGALAALLSTGYYMLRLAGANATPLHLLAAFAQIIYGISLVIFAKKLHDADPLPHPWTPLLAVPMLIAGGGYITIFLTPFAMFVEMIAFAILGGLFLHAWDALARERVHFSWANRWQKFEHYALDEDKNDIAPTQEGNHHSLPPSA